MHKSHGIDLHPKKQMMNLCASFPIIGPRVMEGVIGRRVLSDVYILF